MLRCKFVPVLLIGGFFLGAGSALQAASEADTATPETVENAAPAEQNQAEAADVGEGSEPSESAEPTEQAAHDPATVMPSVQVMDEPEDEKLRAVFYGFRERFPSLNIDAIADGPHPGLYEVVTDSRVVYVSEDMSLLFQGNVIDLNAGVDLTEARLAGIHMGLINELGESKMLVYKAEPASDRNITIFTDINCGYCRLLHSEIDTLLSGGVNVRYLMFPRAGLESDSRVALESVWCAADPQQAMTSAKAGEPITEVACETPVEEHYDLAGKVGLRGTPLIYLDNGTALPGYREASVIIEMINTTEPMSN